MTGGQVSFRLLKGTCVALSLITLIFYFFSQRVTSFRIYCSRSEVMVGSSSEANVAVSSAQVAIVDLGAVGKSGVYRR